MDKTNRNKPPSTNLLRTPDEKAEKNPNPLSALAKSLAKRMSTSHNTKDSTKEVISQKIPKIKNKTNVLAHTSDVNSMMQRSLNGKHSARDYISGSRSSDFFRNNKGGFEKNEAVYKTGREISTAPTTTSTENIDQEPVNSVKDLCEKMHSHPNFPNIYIAYNTPNIQILKLSGPDNLVKEMKECSHVLTAIWAGVLGTKEIKDPANFSVFVDDVCELIERKPDINIIIGALGVLNLSSDEREDWLKNQGVMTTLPPVRSYVNNKNGFEKNEMASKNDVATTTTSIENICQEPIDSVEDLCAKMHSHPNFPNIYIAYNIPNIQILKLSGPDNLVKEMKECYHVLMAIRAGVLGTTEIKDPANFPVFVDDVCELIERKPDINIIIGALGVLNLSNDEREDWLRKNE